MKTRVVVTGIGVVTPLGNRLDLLWDGVIQQRKSILEQMQIGDRLQSVCSVKEFTPPKNYENADRQIQFALLAAQTALQEAQLNSERVGVYLSSSKGGMQTFSKYHETFLKHHHLPSDFVSNFFSHTPAQIVAQYLKCYGPSLNWVAACASGAHAILMAHRLIQQDPDQIVLAGSCEASLTPFILSGFMQMGVLASGNKGCQPFDLHRKGFVPGEGAAVLVLESLEHAQRRGALIHAELAGGSMLSDSTHMVHFDPSGESIARTIQRGIKDAGLRQEEIGYVNLHATGTQENDWIETQALKKIWGERQMPALSGTKPATGHLLGASGSLEAVVAILALQKQFVPPTLNLHSPDPECDLDYTPNIGREQQLQHTMSLSYGFGGHIAALVFRKIEN